MKTTAKTILQRLSETVHITRPEVHRNINASGRFGWVVVALMAAISISYVAILQRDHEAQKAKAAMAEEGLEHVKELNSMILRAFDETGAATVVSDFDGGVLEWSMGAERLLGYGAEEMTYRKIDILIPEQFRPFHDKAFEKMKEHPTGKVHSLPCVAVAANGASVPVYNYVFVAPASSNIISVMVPATNMVFKEGMARDFQ